MELSQALDKGIFEVCVIGAQEPDLFHQALQELEQFTSQTRSLYRVRVHYRSPPEDEYNVEAHARRLCDALFVFVRNSFDFSDEHWSMGYLYSRLTGAKKPKANRVICIVSNDVSADGKYCSLTFREFIDSLGITSVNHLELTSYISPIFSTLKTRIKTYPVKIEVNRRRKVDVRLHLRQVEALEKKCLIALKGGS
jgi:hypothetical protein